MRLRSSTGAIDQSSRSDLACAGKKPFEDADCAGIGFTGDLSVAETRRKARLVIDWMVQDMRKWTYPGAIQFTMTLLELKGAIAAICLIMKI